MGVLHLVCLKVVVAARNVDRLVAIIGYHQLEKYFTKGFPYKNPKAFAMLLMLERFQRFLGLSN